MEGNHPYISSGTWSLLGVKMPKPITDNGSQKANYSNEGGVGYNRYQKNIMGMWLVNELQRELCPQMPFPEIVRLAEDIAGGLMVTMPAEKDFKSDMVVGKNGETIGDFCNKFFVGNGKCTTEERMRVMRFLENICLGSAAVGYRTESMHGAGSPQAQRIMIARQGNIQGKKELAKAIAGIK
jgi:4-hydroxybutyryl-CoA dehydratase/vinylacetyl-CoA-Delta-isomerase